MVPLESSKLFKGLNPDELGLLRQAAQKRTFAAEEVVFHQGDKGDGIYVIEEGAVRLSAMVTETESRTLAHAEPGEFFGEMAVLDEEPRSATAIAERPTTAYFISRADLIGLLESFPRMSVSMVREFSLRMRDFNRRYLEEVLQAERLTLVGRFARSIVHDFKNPLNVIGLAADLVSMQGASPAYRDSAARRIRKQVDRLGNMINELLEFTRGGQTAVALAAVNLPAFIDQLLQELRAELELKQVEIVVQGDVPEIAVLLDPQRLTHVFYNLCHNAVDAMPDGGKIYFRFAISGGELVIEIEDTGQGIAPEIAGRLFEAFATYGKAQGTGLGLSICKRIIQDHRGWIRAVSHAGRGAIFAIGLPLARESHSQPLPA